MSKVLLMVVDALASRVVRPAVERGELPNVRRLIERGQCSWESTAIFPSITPAATAAIVTGCYPAEHGISGAFWYDEEADSVAYYGDDFWVVLNEGIGRFFDDFLVRLNGERLKAETAFEIVEKAGLQAGCLNYLWFRGTTEHQARVPFLLKLLPGVPSKHPILGPSMLFLGDFLIPSQYSQNRKRRGDEAPAGALRRFGFDDRATGAELLGVVEAKQMPDFTLAYFPDNDFESHDVGPQESLPVLKEFDETLGELFDACGGIDACLDQFTILVTGDHSQSDLSDEDDTGIFLDDLLQDYVQAKVGQPWEEDDQIMICPNMRAAQIYIRKRSGVDRQQLIACLLSDPRVDQVILREEQSINAPRAYRVETSDRGTLRFWHAGKHEVDAVRDAYGTRWRYEGDLRAIDAQRDDSGELTYGDYPNALERVAMAFCEESGALWVTARLGHEFALTETTVHDGGSHGSLHKLDSTSPLIVAGSNLTIELPENPRSVDVLELCLAALGVERKVESR